MGNQENELYHFVGIKGSGMNSLTLVLHREGYSVQGSNVEEHFFIQRDLEKSSTPTSPFNADNIDKNMIVITGNAFPDTHEEIVRAIELGAEVIRYHSFITRSIEPYTSIIVIGLHGKTSTTGLLARVLGGINPTSHLIGDGTGHGESDADFFAFEACRYRRHFLAYSPDYTIMTSIDFDCPNYYKNIKGAFLAFQTIAHQVREGISTYGDSKYLRQLGSEVPVYRYGINEGGDIQARNIRRTAEGSFFNVYHKNDFVGHFVLPAFGHRNIMNTLDMIAMAYFEKLDMQKAAGEVLSSEDVRRRFSERKVSDTITVDDYAHHSAKIKTMIDGACQRYPDRETIVIFQPHTFMRTITLMDEFAKAPDLADEVPLYNISGSTRGTQGEVRIENLGEKTQKGGQVIIKDNMSPLLDFENAVVVFMDAGDVQKFEQAYEALLSDTTRNVL